MPAYFKIQAIDPCNNKSISGANSLSSKPVYRIIVNDLKDHVMKRTLSILGILLVTFLGLTFYATSSTEQTVSKGVILNFGDLDKMNFEHLDTVLVAASTLYEGDAIKELMQGEHYRDAWSTPVKVPVIFLDQIHGGLTILEEGGGNQTNSLDLESKEGIVYTLRSVNKSAEKFIPDFLRTLGLENIVVDGISAQHPYGALVAASLADSLDILHTHPQLVFVPKQPSLDTFNHRFGNRLYFLEYENDEGNNWTHFNHVVDLIDTDDLVELIIEEQKEITIDQSALIRARLFDLIIGDWDRHAKQWGWVIQDQEKGLTAIPIPSDRDNAFYNVGGIIPGIVSNKNITPELRPYKEDIDFLPALIKPFDSYFLYGVPVEDFTAEAKFLQSRLTDPVIHEALKTWPVDIYRLNGEEIKDKIKARRDDLLEYARRFHKILEERGKPAEPMAGFEKGEVPIRITNR